MELQKHALILKRSQWFILLITLLTGVAALTFAMIRPESYKAAVSFEVQLINRSPVQDYQYGAYYDLKASELYVQHLMSLFVTPAVVEEVYKTAGFGYEIDSISRFTNRFTTKQYSAQNFVVLFSDYHRDSAEKLGQAITEVVQHHATISGSINQQPIFSVVSFPPVIAPSERNPYIVTIVGVIAGLFASIILSYLREYFRG